jgi:hypothetical protein
MWRSWPGLRGCVPEASGGAEPADVVVTAPAAGAAEIVATIARVRRADVSEGLAHEPVTINTNAAHQRHLSNCR